MAKLDVFLSHNRHDQPAVRAIAEALEAGGLSRPRGSRRRSASRK